jgi:hypothetical protein
MQGSHPLLLWNASPRGTGICIGTRAMPLTVSSLTTLALILMLAMKLTLLLGNENDI